MFYDVLYHGIVSTFSNIARPDRVVLILDGNSEVGANVSGAISLI